MHSYNSVICSAVRLLLQMGIICPYNLQAVQYFKEYSFVAPVRLVFTFATLYVCMVANMCIFRAVFVWWRKVYNFNRFYTDGNVLLPFRLNLQRLFRVFVQTAYISPFAFFVKYFKIISTDGLRVTS